MSANPSTQRTKYSAALARLGPDHLRAARPQNSCSSRDAATSTPAARFAAGVIPTAPADPAAVNTPTASSA
ncbi:hypothetical protein ACWC3X_22230 [Streptomyces populi]